MPQVTQASPYAAAVVINPEDLQAALICMATARRNALLQELADLERLLSISPSTSELRREWRSGQQKAEQQVRLKE